MRRSLQPHPETPAPAVGSIEVEIERQSGARLHLRYRLSASMDLVRVPPPAPSRRADRLWERTCFEAFVRLRGEAYLEFNFSPSGEWAAYRLAGYRSGMSEAPLTAPPTIVTRAGPDGLDTDVELDLAALEELSQDAPWQLGLSAVVEDAAGTRLFWALAHPPGEPDFHHKDCFAIQVAAAEQA
jgi:hypothetical protein